MEVCWTLSRSYGLERAETALTVRTPLNYFENNATDFPDCLIVAKANQFACSHTLTFDQRMKSLPKVQLL
ncbi:MAG: hypothetical protein R8K20_08190 [Gallionellaceae bacterium]